MHKFKTANGYVIYTGGKREEARAPYVYLDRLGIGIFISEARINFVKKLESYVLGAYKDNVTLSDAARHFCFSVGYFARYFKKQMNTTFVNYLTAYRASRASELLVNTNMTIEAVAEACGFVSYRNLSRAFNALYGKSPSAYRREYAE